MTAEQDKGEDRQPLEIGETIRIPEGETPHLFLSPELYLGEGFEELPGSRINRTKHGRGKIFSAKITGLRPSTEGKKGIVVAEVRLPGMIARGVAKAKRRPTETKIKRVL